MKVAIMGAGLSGLACAITLEQHGIEPAIFEKRSRVGDRFVNAEVLLSLMTRPVHDCIAYLSEKHRIYLQPTANLQKMTVYSSGEKAILEGQLGFTNVRGRESDAFEVQLSRQVKSPIRFHSEETYEDLLGHYTHVVMATGDGDYAKRTRNFREDLTVSLRGATVEGTFDRYAVSVWLDNELAPSGYGFCIPFSEKEATIVIAFPDDPAKEEQPDSGLLWDRFCERTTRDLQQTLHVTDTFQFTRYPIGICRSARIGNTFFTGNCFGSLMPYLGFGQFAAILTGIYAAYDLTGQGSYEELTAPLRQSYENSLVLRRTVEHLRNADLDRIVRVLGGGLGGRLMQNKQLNPLQIASYLLRPYVKWKQGVTS
ncbi:MULTISPECIES: NAD(P)/FAD-dependent oxidoreductase [Paenibacillus]|uniref:NAD(P)/FAD-dependent oxidoreductase n=1 Tax=Paenibacillus TaxID=44249 RepID=UPI0022B8C8AE|nr:NAD(P)-binding protein [Paenibacillus caseinilyticus]MCZ8522564.1 NAD(P)-binding protein [Paenibacillus caseinilyticus]